MSGIFGAVSKQDCNELLFYGTDYHSHMGTEYAGLAVLGDQFNRHIRNISQSQFKSRFYNDYLELKGNKGIGVISDLEEQPIYQNSKFGPFCLVSFGFIENKDEIAGQLMKDGLSFSEMGQGGVNATELVAKIISRGNSIVEGIENIYNLIEGSCSLLLLHENGIYAARDRMGYTPLTIGKKHDAWAVTSETSSFPNLGFDIEKFLQPGEIVLLNEDGLVSQKPGNQDQQICSFLWIYTGFPASTYEGINVETVRERCGRAMAKRDEDIEVDVVAGCPDSGTAHALGYAQESGKPYRRPLIKYTPGYGRSYTPPSQETRDLVAKMKLVPIAEIIKGNRLAVCEDSIVRGTQLKNFAVAKLWGSGAKEVHMRPACPPLMFPCKFCFSTRTTNELAARRAIHALEGRDIKDVSEYVDENSEKHKQMVDWIARNLEVTTLRYQKLDDMIEAIGLPKEKLCTYCWTGECPSNEKKKAEL